MEARKEACEEKKRRERQERKEVWRKENGGKTAYYEWLLETSTKGGAK